LDPALAAQRPDRGDDLTPQQQKLLADALPLIERLAED
jgi:hypothetical protein